MNVGLGVISGQGVGNINLPVDAYPVANGVEVGGK